MPLPEKPPGVPGGVITAKIGINLPSCRRTHMPRPLRLLILLSWMALITFWSGQSSLPIDEPPIAILLHGLQHRLAHLAAFGLLALLGRWAFDGWPRARLLAVLLTSAFGAFDEWHQSLIPDRRPAIDDWLFDTFSAALAMVLWPRLKRFRWASRALGPLLVGAAFAIGLSMAVGPHLSVPAELSRSGLRHATIQFAQDALSLARQTRSLARQLTQ